MSTHPRAIVLASEIAGLRTLATQVDPYGKTGYTRARSQTIGSANAKFTGVGADPVTGNPITYAYTSSGVASWVLDIEYMVWAGFLVDHAAWAHDYGARAEALISYALDNWSVATSDPYGDIRREVVRGMAIAYDAFYADLADPTTLATGIRTWGESIRALWEAAWAADPLFLNAHYHKLIYMLGQAGIAMDGEFEEAAEWVALLTTFLDSTVEGYTWPYYAGQTDGAVAEGLYYGIHGGRYRREAFRALDELGYYAPWDMPFMQNLGDSFLYMEPPNLTMWSGHGDGALSTHIASTAKDMRLEAATLSQVYNDAGWRWWFEERLVQGSRMMGSAYGALSFDGLPSPPYHHALWLALLPNRTLQGAAPTTRGNIKRFATTGLLAAHTDLASLTQNTALVVDAQPYPHGAAGHARRSRGSFNLYHNGTPLAVNAGHYTGIGQISWGGPYHYYGGRHTRCANAPVLVKRSTLTAGITATSLSIPIADATGWPDGGATNGYWVWIWDATSYSSPHEDPNWEIIWINQTKSGNSLRLTQTSHRAQWGSTARAHTAGETVEFVLGQDTQVSTDRAHAAIAAQCVGYATEGTHTWYAIDLTDAYNASALVGGDVATRIMRHMLFVAEPEPFVVVLDEFELSSEWMARELLHTYQRATNESSVFTLQTAPTVDEENQVATLVYGDYAARVDLMAAAPLSMVCEHDTDPPIQLTAWGGEGPLSTKLTVANRVLAGYTRHFQFETPTPATSHLIGMVFYPYAVAGAVPAASTGTDNGDGTYTFAVGDWSGTFTLGATPAFELGAPVAGDGDAPAAPFGLRGVHGLFSWLRFHFTRPWIAPTYPISAAAAHSARTATKADSRRTAERTNTKITARRS